MKIIFSKSFIVKLNQKNGEFDMKEGKDTNRV